MGKKTERKYILGRLLFNSLCRKYSTAVGKEKLKDLKKKIISNTNLKIKHNFFLLCIHLTTCVSV